MPNTKEELYLAAILGEYSGELPMPNTKVECYLYKLAKDGVPGGSGGGTVDLSEYAKKEELLEVEKDVKKLLNDSTRHVHTNIQSLMEITAADITALHSTFPQKIYEIEQSLSDYADTKEEVTQARVDANGTSYATLKERLDSADENVESVSTELKGALEYVRTSNLLNHSKVLKDKRLNVWNGTTINSYTYDRVGSYASPIIDVEPNKQYCFVKNNSVVALSNNIGLILFDQDGRYVTDQLTAVNNIYTIPENIYYIAFCTNGNDFSMYNFKEYTNEINLSYEEYGYSPKRLEKIESEISYINNRVPKRKTIVLMNFDAPATFCEDGRYELVEKYNIPCTLNVTISGATSVSKPSKFKEILYKGYDFATYGGYNAPDVSTINSEDESDLLAWDIYVKNSKNAAETVGVFNPTAWFCSNGKTGTALNKALINNGYKIARGYIVDHPIDKGYLIRRENYNNREPLKCNIEFTGLYPQSYETMLAHLDEAIAGGYDIAPFTHGINPDEESASTNYGITYDLLESFFQVLREKADNGEIELMTFREYYKTYYESDGQLNDYSRMLKTTEFFCNN